METVSLNRLQYGQAGGWDIFRHSCALAGLVEIELVYPSSGPLSAYLSRWLHARWASWFWGGVTFVGHR